MLIDEPNENAKTIIKLQEEMYSKAASLFANELFDNLVESELLNSDSLVSANKDDKNFLMWALIQYISAVSGEHLMDNSISFDDVATIRPDGGKHSLCWL